MSPPSTASTARRSSLYANRLFRAWSLGQGGENNGILLLVAKSDRKMRIEVGYGLEGTLTDLHSKLIIENTMVPAFRAGDFSGGISRAVDDIIMVLEGNAAELERAGETQSLVQSNSFFADVDWIFVIFIALWATIFLGGMAMAILPPIFGTKIVPTATAGWAWTSLSAGAAGLRRPAAGRPAVRRAAGLRREAGRPAPPAAAVSGRRVRRRWRRRVGELVTSTPLWVFGPLGGCVPLGLKWPTR